MNFAELQEQAGRLRKEKKFKQALPLFEELFTNYKDQFDQYDWWGYAFTLLQLDKYQEALDIAHQGLTGFPASDYLKNVYSWAIYYLHIRPEPVEDRATFFKAANAILRFSEAENKYSPYAITVFSVIDLLELNYGQHVKDILEWVRKLNPALLDRESYSFVKRDGKKVENASPYEKYYAVLVKALLETGNFEECILTADEAMKTIEKFHNSNNIWIPRNKALALHELGHHRECVDILMKLLTQKNEWYISLDIASAYEAMNEFEKAFKFAIEAAKMNGPVEMKINLFMLLARLFRIKGQNREAILHAAYVNQVRQEKGWSLDERASSLLRELQTQEDTPLPANGLTRELKKIWAENSQQLPRQNGKIKRLLPKGNAGFIKGEDGKDYYFSVRDFTGNSALLVEGYAVNFAIVDAYDRVKEQASVKATDIKKT